MMTDGLRGFWAMVAACTIWGLSSLYYKLLAHIPPLEVLAHRTLWSMVFFGLVLAMQGRLRAVPRLLSAGRALALVAVAALLISTNWFGFIFAIQADRAMEASLGYYIFPLVAVVLGVAVLGERLGVLKWIAVGCAVAAVLVLTLGLGVTPWISILLAVTFGAYGLVKRWISAGPVVSVTAEVTVLAPLALGWLWMVHHAGEGAFGAGWRNALMLMATGPLTAGPLILFSYAAKRLDYATQGLIQYLNPTLQFLIAWGIFQEPFTRWHQIAFGLIWTALALYSLALWRSEGSRTRRSINASTPSSGVTKS